MKEERKQLDFVTNFTLTKEATTHVLTFTSQGNQTSRTVKSLTDKTFSELNRKL